MPVKGDSIALKVVIEYQMYLNFSCISYSKISFASASFSGTLDINAGPDI